MNETIKAAWISGLLQGVPGFLTFIAALAAIRAWRPNALGQRKIKLAEDCLTQAWELDREIHNARMPMYIGLPAYPPEIGETVEQRQKRSAAMPAIDNQFRKCLGLQKEFEKIFALSEFYIGEMPRIPFSGKMTLTIPYEYGMIIGLLRTKLWLAYGSSKEFPDKDIEARIEAYNEYYGWVTDSSYDDFTERLNYVKKVLEQRLREVLQEKGIWRKLQDRATDKIADIMARRKKKGML